MNRIFASLILVCVSFGITPQPATAITIPTVQVGNPGNAADATILSDGTSGYGSVSYAYRIGTTEVTNAQYVDFLNAKAKSDPLGLYNANMSSDIFRGGINRSGASGSFTYATRPNMGNKPVNSVSWYDSIRFANWLNNGQGNGSTENGAYNILGGTATPSNGLSITRNPGATWFLPSENEWYKAAYYQPAELGGPASTYWLYATRSFIDPTKATANSVGDIGNPGANVANYDSRADWNGMDGNVTTVGSAGLLSQSFYGTSDQGGNVAEWNETKFFNDSARGMSGGSFNGLLDYLQSTRDLPRFPTLEDFVIGFRVATVPEPSTFVLAALGALGLLIAARRGR